MDIILQRVFVAVISIFLLGLRAPAEPGGLLSAMETIVISKGEDYGSGGEGGGGAPVGELETAKRR